MDKFDLTYELQKKAAESDDIDVIIDENGDIEFEMDVKTFVELLKKAWT
jgi:nucleoside-triphosphatase THEP1